jgi:hypothetical protein
VCKNWWKLQSHIHGEIDWRELRSWWKNLSKRMKECLLCLWVSFGWKIFDWVFYHLSCVKEDF